MRKATHRGILQIGETEITCFVLEDGTRVISGRGMMKAIGMRGRGQGMVRIATNKALKPYLNKELGVAMQSPIYFLGTSSRVANPTAGYEATILLKICEEVLSAHDDGALRLEHDLRYAKACGVLIRAFAKVGIIALVDEATGYEEIRDRLALQKILDEFLLEEKAKWAKRFPDDFYKEMFRLNRWGYSPLSVKRPSVVGRYTNDIVYQRLAPGVLKELRLRNPPDHKGRRKHRHHEWLTKDVGHPKLQEHLLKVIVLMKASPNWSGFKRLLARALPKYGEPLEFPFEEN